MPRTFLPHAFILLSLISCSDVSAQDSPPGLKLAGVWTSAGYGVPLHGTDAAYFSLILATRSDKIILIRAAGTRDHETSVSFDASVLDFGFLAGEIERPTKSVIIYAAGGVGTAQVTSRGRFLGWKRDAYGTPVELLFEKVKATRFAVPLEAHVLYAPLKYAALGVSFFGDWNSERSFSAVAVTLHLGYLPLRN